MTTGFVFGLFVIHDSEFVIPDQPASCRRRLQDLTPRSTRAAVPLSLAG